MSKQTKTKIITLAVVLLFTIIYGIYLDRLLEFVPINSDYASLTYEAWDIVQGNILLSGWHQTGLSFYFTDLAYFVIGVLTHGFGVRAYNTAICLMIIVIFFASIPLVRIGHAKKDLLAVFMLISMVLLPSELAMYNLRAHTAVMSLGFLGLFFVNKFHKTTDMKYLYTSMIFFALGFSSDPIVLVTIIAPICAYYVMEYTFANSKKDGVATKVIVGMMIAVVAGLVIDRLFYAIGGAYKNSFFGGQKFIGITDFTAKFQLYIECLLHMTDSYFFGTEIKEIVRILKLIPKIVILCAEFVVLIYYMFQFFARKSRDLVATTLSISVIVISLLFVFTTISIDLNSARYIGYVNYALAIILIRFLMRAPFLKMRFFFGKLSGMTLITVTSVMVFLISLKIPDGNIQLPEKKAGLIEYMYEHDIKSAYSGFWNSAIIGLFSEDELHVRPIIASATRASVYDWYTVDYWYEEPTYVLIYTDEEDGGFWLDGLEGIYEVFGEPVSTDEIDGYKILYYDYDISTMINGNYTDWE